MKGSLNTSLWRYALMAALAAVALVALGCGGSKKGTSKPADSAAGSQGCVTPTPGGRLCGEDAVDWCNAHPGQKPEVQGDCDEVLGRKGTDPQSKSSGRTPDEQNPPPYTPPADYQASPSPSDHSQAAPSDSGESGSSQPTDQSEHTQQYRCEEQDAPDKYEQGCQGKLVPIG